MNYQFLKFCCLAASLMLVACNTPQIQLDKNLETNVTTYEVTGRQGWLVNQKLSFGEYQSGKVNRSWTKGYDLPFIVRFTGAKEKLSFSLYNGKKNEAEVFCLGKLREQDLQLFHKYFDININAKDAFTGSVVLDEHNAYDFYVTNLNQNNWFKEAEGLIYSDQLNIAIRPVTHLSTGKKMLDMQVPGFEFVKDGKAVGAVETLNKGRIWLSNDLNDNHRLVLASVAAALLLRSGLTDHNEDVL